MAPDDDTFQIHLVYYNNYGVLQASELTTAFLF